MLVVVLRASVIGKQYGNMVVVCILSIIKWLNFWADSGHMSAYALVVYVSHLDKLIRPPNESAVFDFCHIHIIYE